MVIVLEQEFYSNINQGKPVRRWFDSIRSHKNLVNYNVTDLLNVDVTVIDYRKQEAKEDKL